MFRATREEKNPRRSVRYAASFLLKRLFARHARWLMDRTALPPVRANVGTGLRHAFPGRRLPLPHLFSAPRALEAWLPEQAWKLFRSGWKFYVALCVITFGLLILLAQGIPGGFSDKLGPP
jgi:hypothetical protein